MSNNHELAIAFSPDGTVEAMHMDGFDLGFLGDKRITRATEIKFNEKDQSWGLHLPVDEMPCWVPVLMGQGFATYERARQFEVHWLNVCRIKAIDPDSGTGEQVLQHIRSAVEHDGSYPMTLDAYEKWLSFFLDDAS